VEADNSRKRPSEITLLFIGLMNARREGKRKLSCRERKGGYKEPYWSTIREERPPDRLRSSA